MVEMEAGNLKEALGLAQKKQDVLLEALVWEKLGSFESATRLIMLHVITESLWSSGSKGWPPKSFPDSEDLFTLVKFLAKKVSDCFYTSICSELYLLNEKPKTFSELRNLLNEAVKSQNIRLKFLSLRALIHHLTRKHSEFMFELESVLDLEKRLHEAVDNDKISLDTLFAIWGRWRKMVTKVSTALDEELCRDYLGVRIKTGLGEDNSDVYHVLNSNASWIKTCVRASLQDDNTSQYLVNSHKYISCAKSYWNLELFRTGKGVVEKLESLVLSSRRQPPCPVTKARFTLSMYGITEFIKQLKCDRNTDKMVKFLYSAEGLFLDFWDMFFPLDLKGRATQLVTIDDFPVVTELVYETLDQILSNTKCKLTYGKLGRIFMFLFLATKFPVNWLSRISERVDKPEWWDLFASLKTNFDCGSERKSFVMKLHSALQATYKVDWKHEPDYMSPHCFLFLLELLMFSASSCLGTVGYMITTRSTLSQIVQLRGCESLWNSPLEMVLDDGTRNWVQSLFEFILHTVRQFLRIKSEIQEWLSQCYLPTELIHPTILRLATIFNLAYVNKTLLGNGEVSCDLCQELSIELEESIRLVVFADAFASVGDPLVVISAKNYGSQIPPSNSIFFCRDELRNRDHVMSVLFPKVSSIAASMSKESFADVPSTCVTNEGTQDLHEGSMTRK
ncbi:hypothetical protein FCM35_KLT02663 [Carex littledalei]|uniref:Uncharacterized protein n=1 Tax=Carex littledalei TaxID=544730 RepID=A0A833VBX8_9POAL|nr:hypothetical protein FCM35_KLT02663 [Carex littledalei]